VNWIRIRDQSTRGRCTPMIELHEEDGVVVYVFLQDPPLRSASNDPRAHTKVGALTFGS